MPTSTSISFRHIPLWNRRLSRIEAYLESTIAQSVFIPALDMDLSFAPGERIHTENSYKYTDDDDRIDPARERLHAGAHLVRPQEMVRRAPGAGVGLGTEDPAKSACWAPW